MKKYIVVAICLSVLVLSEEVFLQPTAKTSLLSTKEMGQITGASSSPCYHCDYRNCPGDHHADARPFCSYGFATCFSGCQSYCEQLQTEFWCNYTGSASDGCDPGLCTQTCPPVVNIVNTAACLLFGVSSCPACTYVPNGSC